jgi:hypothetical protein
MRDQALNSVLERPGIAQDLVLRTPRNWTPTGYFGALGAIHLIMSIVAFTRGRWQGYLSLILGIVFLAAAVVSFLVRYEMAILARRRMIRLRWGWRHLNWQRLVPFSDARAVRLTIGSPRDFPRCQIEILCDGYDLDCPPTPIPHQLALYLAMTLNVRLIKVSSEGVSSDPLSELPRYS